MSTLVSADRLFEDGRLRRSLERLVTAGRPPRTDDSIPVCVDEDDIHRIREALDRLATDEELPDPLERAVTSLDVSLQEPLFWIERGERPLMIAFDAVDVAVMALAITHGSAAVDDHASYPELVADGV